MDRQLLEFHTPAWTHLLGEVVRPGRPVTLALPCVGIDGAGHALKAMGVDFHAVYVHDIRPHLRKPVSQLHGQARASHFQLDDVEGDILNVNVHEWCRVDGVVAGPPCPPWSSIGKRSNTSDPRERVFRKVSDIIVDQGHKGAFFFILEMVPGIQHRQQGHASSYHQEWIQELRRRAPQWHTQWWCLNASSFGLPQDSRRVYTVGINMLSVGIPATPPFDKLHCSTPSPTTLGLFLHPRLPNTMEDTLNANMASNLRAYKEVIKQELTNGPQGSYACISLDRCPSKEFGTWIRVDGMVDTFRTCNEHLWLLSLGEGPTGPSVSRPLHPVERLVLQGFPSWVGRHLSKRQLLEATGNSFAVPVIGCALTQVLNAVARAGRWTIPVQGPPLMGGPSPIGIDGDLTGQQQQEAEDEAKLASIQEETQALLEAAAHWRRQANLVKSPAEDCSASTAKEDSPTSVACDSHRPKRPRHQRF